MVPLQISPHCCFNQSAGNALNLKFLKAAYQCWSWFIKRLQCPSVGPVSQIKTCSNKGNLGMLSFKSALNVFPRYLSLFNQAALPEAVWSGYLSLRVRNLLVLTDTSLFPSFSPSFLLYNLLGGLHHLLIPVQSQLILRNLGNILFLVCLSLSSQGTPFAGPMLHKQQQTVSTTFQSGSLLFRCWFFSMSLSFSVLFHTVEWTLHGTLKASLQ